MQVLELQNIFDLALQNYGTLDQVVKLATDNGLSLDETPPVGQEIAINPIIGENRVKTYTLENNHVYSNEAIEATVALLANDDTALSPQTDVIFIYK